jgi:replication factor A2
MYPLTIKQLIEAAKNNADDTWSVDGVPLHHIKLVATIESKESHATNHNYSVSDGSGTIECKKWTDSNDGMNEADDKCA